MSASAISPTFATPPSSEVESEIGSTLPCDIGDQSALINRAASARGQQIVFSRQSNEPKIDLRTGHMVPIVVVRADRQTRGMR